MEITKSSVVKADAAPSTSTSSRTRTKRLILMGDRKSGKSSIAGVVFHKTPPSETLFTEATMEITQGGLQSFMNYQLVELPGHFDFNTHEFDHIFREKGSVIWVMDAQDQYLDALTHLLETITFLYQRCPHINIEVFVHKMDGLSEEFKNDTFRDVRQRVQDELSDLGFENAAVSFHQTSIYDHSVKIFVATDTSLQDTESYEVCSDLIDVVVDIGELYSWDRNRQIGYEEGAKTDFGNDACESFVMMERPGFPYLYLREMDQFLALVCIMGDDNPMERKALVDYNVGIFKDALLKAWQT